MNKISTIFYCDAGKYLGLGHLTRCRALAVALRNKGSNCIMVGPSHKYKSEQDDGVFQNWISRKRWESTTKEAENLKSIVMEYSATHAVLDDYRVDSKFQLKFLESKIPWVQFDGSGNNPIWADWILNASPSIRKEKYKYNKRNLTAKLLLGPSYAILRSEFPPVVNRSLNRPIKKILMNFGGGDDRGAVIFVLGILISMIINDVKIVVVSGSHNPRNKENKDWINDNAFNKVCYEINPKETAKCFSDCDLAIISGGTVAYEVASCGVPMILLPIANNQIKPCRGWAALKAAMYRCDFSIRDSEGLKRTIIDLFNDVSLRVRLAKNAINQNIGYGTEKISNMLLNYKHN